MAGIQANNTCHLDANSTCNIVYLQSWDARKFPVSLDLHLISMHTSQSADYLLNLFLCVEVISGCHRCNVHICGRYLQRSASFCHTKDGQAPESPSDVMHQHTSKACRTC